MKKLLVLASFALALSISLPTMASSDSHPAVKPDSFAVQLLAVMPDQASPHESAFAVHDAAAMDSQPEKVTVFAMAGGDAICMASDGNAKPLCHTRMNL